MSATTIHQPAKLTTDAQRYEAALSWQGGTQRPEKPAPTDFTGIYCANAGGWLPAYRFADGSLYFNTMALAKPTHKAAANAAKSRA